MSTAAPISVEIDEQADIVTICGVRYSAELFRAFGFGPLGTWLRIERREGGAVTIFNLRAGDFAADVLSERARQITEEGWTPGHDDRHGDGAMAVAAACYALADRKALEVQTVKLARLWEWTGWAAHWFKPEDRRRNLVRATALLLAEGERLDRATERQS